MLIQIKDTITDVIELQNEQSGGWENTYEEVMIYMKKPICINQMNPCSKLEYFPKEHKNQMISGQHDG